MRRHGWGISLVITTIFCGIDLICWFLFWNRYGIFVLFGTLFVVFTLLILICGIMFLTAKEVPPDEDI